MYDKFCVTIFCSEKQFTLVMAQTFKAHPINSMKYTTCFNLHKWQEYRTSWPLKDVTGDSSPTWSSLRRIMGNNSEIHEVSSAKNTRCTHCHLQGTLTLMAEIEPCLNSRPLCVYLVILPTQYTYLSTALFLIGEPLTQLPSVDYTNVKCNRFSRWQTYQQHLQHFWLLWSSDYLQELQQRQRWQRTPPNPTTGGCSTEGGQHYSSPSAHSCQHQRPPRVRWHR